MIQSSIFHQHTHMNTYKHTHMNIFKCQHMHTHKPTYMHLSYSNEPSICRIDSRSCRIALCQFPLIIFQRVTCQWLCLQARPANLGIIENTDQQNIFNAPSTNQFQFHSNYYIMFFYYSWNCSEISCVNKRSYY